MEVHTTINPSLNFATLSKRAEGLNNEGFQLSNLGDNAGAELLHKQALELKLRAHGPNSTKTALTLNALGEVQSLQGKFEEAEANLRKAVAIRNASGGAFDAAVSRENLAQVLETKEKFSEAKEIRDHGRPDKLSCGNYNCPGQLFAFSQMKQCSRCHCIYYCSVACQKRDWKSRHKRFCKETDL
ncbi:hypothetical protein JB92DRAFT_2699550 [Gautieria morchelliformis]|nr:hypothetical protein JB92DRAFT_2699550 [Gautieria morchelliformis]